MTAAGPHLCNRAGGGMGPERLGDRLAGVPHPRCLGSAHSLPEHSCAEGKQCCLDRSSLMTEGRLAPQPWCPLFCAIASVMSGTTSTSQAAKQPPHQCLLPFTLSSPFFPHLSSFAVTSLCTFLATHPSLCFLLSFPSLSCLCSFFPPSHIALPSSGASQLSERGHFPLV